MSATASYLSVAQYLTLRDHTAIVDLVSDDGTAVTEGSLTSNDELAELLLVATGHVEAGLVAWGLYTDTVLTALAAGSTVAGSMLRSLVADQVDVLLYKRRMDVAAQHNFDVTEREQILEWRILSLAVGDRALNPTAI